MLRHWSQFVPDISTDIRGHEALHYHHHHREQRRVQELCERRGGRPGLPVLMSLTVSVDVNNIEPCLGLSLIRLICQPTFEDMKLYTIINKEWRSVFDVAKHNYVIAHW